MREIHKRTEFDKTDEKRPYEEELETPMQVRQYYVMPDGVVEFTRPVLEDADQRYLGN